MHSLRASCSCKLRESMSSSFHQSSSCTPTKAPCLSITPSQPYILPNSLLRLRPIFTLFLTTQATALFPSSVSPAASAKITLARRAMSLFSGNFTLGSFSPSSAQIFLNIMHPFHKDSWQPIVLYLYHLLLPLAV